MLPHGLQRRGIDRDTLFLASPQRAEFELTRNQDFVKTRCGPRRLDVGHGFVHEPSELFERAERGGVHDDEADAVAEHLRVL